MTTTTDTPRTDAVASANYKDVWDIVETYSPFARQLERELSATKDEYCKTAFALTEQTERAEQAEAEVERLRQALSFIANDDASHDSTEYYRGVAYKTLNQDKK